MKLDYCSVEELASAAKSCGKTIGQIVLEEQAESMELTVREVFEKMSSEFQVMKQSVTDGLNPDLRSASGLSGGAAAKMHTAVLLSLIHILKQPLYFWNRRYSGIFFQTRLILLQ